MADAKQSWDEVASRGADLGSKLREHLDGAGTDAEAADLKDALGKLGAAVDRGLAAAEHAARDEAVRQDLARFARSLSDALVASFAEAGHELAEALKAHRHDPESPPT